MDVDYSTLSGLIRSDRLLVGVFIIAVAIVLSRVITTVLDRWGEGAARRRLVLKRVASILRFVIFIGAAALAITNVFHLSNEAMLALGGTLAVTAGFAFKDTAASLISGVLILIDQPFQVGDRIVFDGTYGEVREIGLRSVRVVTVDDNLVSIPTNKFLTDAVASANAGELDMMIVVNFYIAQDADFELAMRLAREATVTSKFVFLNKPVSVLISDVVIADQFVTRVCVKAYVIDARFEARIVSDITAKTKRAFREHGILLPGVRPASSAAPPTPAPTTA